jgi:hypothetical protein
VAMVLLLYVVPVVVAFFVAAMVSSRWLPWIVPVGMAAYWLVRTLELGAENDNGTGANQPGVAALTGVVAVAVLVGAVGAGKLVRGTAR